MTQLPPLPEKVSSNGQEIWDWGRRFSEAIHREEKICKLSRDIRKIGTECGDCHKWMKSSVCPRERNVNGRNRGPSCASSICSQFVETPSATKRRQTLSEELDALKLTSQKCDGGADV